MDYQVNVSTQAGLDAVEVHERIAKDTPRTADRWLQGLFDAIASLTLFPERCSLAPEATRVTGEIRQLFYGKRRHRYRVLFVIEAHTVRVLRVVHGARRRLRRDQLG
jgi:plasmid stabilization system protein ParE